MYALRMRALEAGGDCVMLGLFARGLVSAECARETGENKAEGSWSVLHAADCKTRQSKTMSLGAPNGAPFNVLQKLFPHSWATPHNAAIDTWSDKHGNYYNHNVKRLRPLVRHANCCGQRSMNESTTLVSLFVHLCMRSSAL
jgi:hypothetical protein